MTPIHDLLNRIKWDPTFSGEFCIGYYDRVVDQTVEVPLKSLSFDPTRKDVFILSDEDGLRQSVPLHRVRTVHRNGDLIWQRK